MSEIDEEVPPGRVIGALDVLLQTPPFLRSPKLARFLRFVVEEELAGRGATIKAYTIATQALGRGPDFDPSLDPSVRVEAGRLRRALEDVYARHAGGIDVRLAIPVGGYRPRFIALDAAPSLAEMAPEPDPEPGDVPLPATMRRRPTGGISPRGETMIIALLAGILLVLCIDLALTVSARFAPDPAPTRELAVRRQ
ncbi:hypothetical protein [uncultured Methylobacterium sp.]|uniref:hypothetical protein n=1 Tax=uncultured Methylobacterium sp. TaxID=157278 RepID=UPI002594A50F|nr:hypothetical protein [uncultured Methylobacterium sp.]